MQKHIQRRFNDFSKLKKAAARDRKLAAKKLMDRSRRTASSSLGDIQGKEIIN
jgi:hypothetical protein